MLTGGIRAFPDQTPQLQIGASLSYLFVSASEFLAIFAIAEVPCDGLLFWQDFCPQHVSAVGAHTALTNFFNLSNIHPDSRRSSGMVRTSQCFRTEFSQLDGPPTLAAAEAIPYTLVCSASLIKLDRGVYPLDFSPAQMAFSRVEFSLRVHESVPIHLPRSAVSPLSTGMPAPSEIVARIWKAAVRGNA